MKLQVHAKSSDMQFHSHCRAHSICFMTPPTVGRVPGLCVREREHVILSLHGIKDFTKQTSKSKSNEIET